MDQLSRALTDLDARIRVEGVLDGRPFDHSGNSLATTPINLLGVQVHVASLLDVIRSKQAANRGKDQRVLPTLREILARGP